jgi:hypothetical protein
MAEGIVAGVQPWLEGYRILPDGSHRSGNCHLSMRAALGVAEIGVVTSNARLIEWARRVYEFTRSIGTDWGWYPENMVKPAYRYRSETCVTGDMVEAAVAFAQAGYTEYWDHVERAVRNYLPAAQFFLTPAFEALYREVHISRQAEEVKAGLQMLRRLEGGFLARQRPNDWVYETDGRPTVNMMGCCPPEGMRALYLAWRNTVIENDDAVYVHMALDRDAPAGRVVVGPDHGSLCVEARCGKDYYVRPPSWAPLEEVRVYRNGTSISAQWAGNYIVFRGAQSGDTLEISFPVPRFIQTVAIGEEGTEEIYQARWIGNHLEEVSPHGRFLPIFAGPRSGLSPLPSTLDHPSANLRSGQGLSDDDWKPDA